MFTIDVKYHFKNQAEYELIGNYVCASVKYKLLTDYNLKTIWVPTNNIKREGKLNFKNFVYDYYPQADIYISDDFFEKNKKLLCLIQGTGSVKAGYN